MIITPEKFREFHRKNVYFRSIIPISSMSNATLRIIDQRNAPMKIKSIGQTILVCKIPHIDGFELESEIKLKIANLGRKWVLMSLFGENPNNVGRRNCFRCGRDTELRRDFLTFTVREFCIHCML